MRIAFITYEFPPDIAQGGIATYTEQITRIMKRRGHDIEVFCGSNSRQVTEEIDGILIHRVLTSDPKAFKYDVYNIFNERYQVSHFDVIECPEIHANALIIKEKIPNIPLIVKLHMPLFVQMRLYNYYTSPIVKFRFFLGALRRGRIRKYGQYDYLNDIDYKITALANGIVSPSLSLRKIIAKEWHLNEVNIKVIPYPFEAKGELLEIPINNEVPKVVTFVGKLNVHKGLVNLLKTIPLVAKKHPDVLFKLIGADSFFAVKKMNMSAYIKHQLIGYEHNYVILGGLEYTDVMNELSKTAVCIFPSIWENFPLVCLEAMGAGRAIVGSNEGGMNEMLSGDAGIIIDPLNVKKMAKAVMTLLDDDKLRFQYGTRARAKLLVDYNPEKIGKQIEEHFLNILNG